MVRGLRSGGMVGQGSDGEPPVSFEDGGPTDKRPALGSPGDERKKGKRPRAEVKTEKAAPSFGFKASTVQMSHIDSESANDLESENDLMIVDGFESDESDHGGAAAAGGAGAAAAMAVEAAGPAEMCEDDDNVDGEIWVTKDTGGDNQWNVALTIYPHVREHCKNKPFGTKEFCDNCYCYVCDAPASGCSSWDTHYKATSSTLTWQRARIAKKAGVASSANGGAAALAAAAAVYGGHPYGHLYGRRARRQPIEDQAPYNCRELLSRLKQVYPDEIDAPPGLEVEELRPYQRQSLAFMLHNEKVVDGSDLIGVVQAPKRASVIEPALQLTEGDLKIRGGWLTDEVGMGKTMCCIGLVLANPCKDASTAADCAEMEIYQNAQAQCEGVVQKANKSIAEAETLLEEYKDEDADVAKGHIFAITESTTDMEGNTTRQHPLMTEAHKKCNRDAKSFLQKSNHYLNQQYTIDRRQSGWKETPAERVSRSENCMKYEQCAKRRDAFVLALQAAQRFFGLDMVVQLRRVLYRTSNAAAKAATTDGITATIQANKTVIKDAESVLRDVKRPVRHLKLKATLVVVPPTLIGQWKDEFNKFAPSLKVFALHGSSRQGQVGYGAAPEDADVVIVSSHSKNHMATSTGQMIDTWHGDVRFQFHRIIQDECHIGTHTPRYSPLRWGLTGTPVSTSIFDLKRMSQTLGHWTSGLSIRDQISRRGAASSTAFTAETFQTFVESLKRLVMLHTKDMVIAGSNALTLPKLDCATVFVELSKTERKLYDMAKKHCVSKIQARVSWQGTGVDMFGFDMLANDAKQCLAGSFKHFESMRGKMQQVNNYAEFEVGHEKRRSHRALISKATKAIPSKLKALLDDLLALGEVEPAFQAVVFTRSTETHARLVRLLSDHDIMSYQLASSVSMKTRHDSIRNFQKPDGISKVMVATIRTGNVGITLTAATRVYLLEPCMDPAEEIQCAGRIHRLGQTKEVFVKRFCYQDTIESAVVKLHTKIDDGSITVANNRLRNDALEFMMEHM
eukprot:m.375810 g.375810  ORF g.375810 m.375810 type:complete len:1020 (+) comp28186_c1_seq1:26-3085(+)